MASLMAAADIAIGAGGTTSWERCCLGLPALVVITAENQRQNAETLERAGAVRILGWHEDVDSPTVAAGISKVLSDRAGCRAMSAAAAAICDGQGTLRVLLAMGGAEKTGRGGSVTLRLAEDEDCDLMLRWQRDPEVRRHFRNPQAPSAAEHQAWFRHCQEDPSRHLAMVVHEGRSAGVLRLDRTGDGQAYEISILIAPEMHKNGIAGAALSLIRKVMPGETFHAQVLPGNEASEALFRRAGFQAAGDTFFRSAGAGR